MLTGFRTYELSMELYQKCEKLSLKYYLPYYLKDQLLRASLSVVLNIVEGSAKCSLKDRRRFYNIALASLRETQVLLQLTKRQEEFKIADQLGACLYRLIYPKPGPGTGPESSESGPVHSHQPARL